VELALIYIGSVIVAIAVQYVLIRTAVRQGTTDALLDAGLVQEDSLLARKYEERTGKQ
jgi:hypothetical protein